MLGTLVACALVAPPFAIAAIVAERFLAEAADERSYVVILRHGNAPGRNEPENFNLDDCRTQRNLSDNGRDEMRDIGEQVRRQGIKVTEVLTSRWCRARETAELLKIGPVKNEPAFDNLEFNKNHTAELLDRERQLIMSWRGPGVLVIVTHSSNIKALTGLELDQGVMIVADPTQAGRITFRPSKISLKDIFS